MKKRRIDRQQDILMFFLRPFVYIWMRMDAKRKVYLGEGVSFKRKEPFVMLANHTFMFDVVHVPMRFRNVPFIVANHTLFKKKATKFLVSQVAHVISKQKGQSDTATVRDLIGAVKRGYPILIFPEGDTTFFGATNYIEESTMKLIKKLEIDVITCNVREGYLSKPRWATSKRKKRSVSLHYELTIPKDKVKSMSTDDINETIKKALHYDAYEDQRQKMIPHPSKALAEGIENVVYVCPSCQSIASMRTEGNKIWCASCQTQGHMDDYGFIHGFAFDNLIEWNNYQKTYRDQLIKASFSSPAHLYYVDDETLSMTDIGDVTVIYSDNQLIFEGALNEVIPVQEMINPTITFRRDFGFFYQDRSFIVQIEKYIMAFLRATRDKY